MVLFHSFVPPTIEMISGKLSRARPYHALSHFHPSFNAKVGVSEYFKKPYCDYIPNMACFVYIVQKPHAHLLKAFLLNT